MDDLSARFDRTIVRNGERKKVAEKRRKFSGRNVEESVSLRAACTFLACARVKRP